MKMRNLITTMFLLLASTTFAQENYLWPIPNKKAGDDILYRPQDYLGVADGGNTNLFIQSSLC